MRRLSAILSIDVVGYSRLMGRDEEGTLAELAGHRAEVIGPKSAVFRGKTIKLIGDGALMEFASAVDAARFAVAVQCTMAARNAEVPEDRRIEFRIGINIGDIIAEGGDIFGDGVNIAARLEGLAEPGGICLHQNVRDQVRDKLALDFEDLGDVEVKNIARPVRAFQVVMNVRAEALAAAPVEARPETAKNPSRLVQAVAGIVLSLVLIAGLAWWQPWRPEFEPASIGNMAYPLPDKPSVAVLPFENLGGDVEDTYFATGVTKNVVTELARFSNLFVIAHNSTSAYEHQPVTIRQVSETLGIQYVLTGSVQRSHDSIRVNTQLIDALTGRHLWAERYDRDPTDLFAVQDEVTKQIVATLAAESGLLADAWQKRTARKGTDSLRAYDLDLQGWAAVKNWTREEFARAEELFEQAISADPDYARPYANLALNTVWQVYSNFAPEEALSRAVALAQEAIARDEGEAWGHWALGAAYLKLGRYDQAVAAYERALALNPNDADVLAESSFLFSWVGRSGEAIENVTAAMRLNPRFEDWYLWGLGVAYYDARKYHEAAKTLASHKSPNLKSNLYLAAAYGQLGRQADAKAVIKAILAENRDSSIELWGKAQPYRNEADLNHYIEGLRKAGLPEQPPLALPDKPSVAVLAFDNLSGDPGQEFLSDGISESIITELSRFSELFVIARHSSFKYKGEAADVRRIGRELGVRYIVEGSMQRAGDGLRVTAQLIDAASGMHVWAESFDRRHADIFAVQDAIIEAIVTALAIKVEEAERLRATRKSTSSLEAYDLFLRARDLQLRKGFWIKEVNREVQEILEQATALDPRFSRAYADLAWTHLYDFIFKWSFPPEAARNRAHALAQKAVEIDPSSARAHYALGYVYLYQKEYELAATEVKRALALNPSDARLRAGSAGLNIYGGDPERAIEQIKEAMRLNPYHEDWYWHFLGWARFHTGAYEEALEAMKRIVNPGAGDHRVMAAINARLGRLEEAARHADEVLKREPDFAISHFRRNLPYRNESDAEDYAGALALAGLPENRPLALPDKPSIAVLALDELSIGDDRGYLADAISEAIITELSRFPELFVIARNSSFKYKGTATDMRDIGRELGVRYVLEGSLQKAGDRLRVTVQLIDALVGNHVWADTYDRNLADIFAVQDEITRTIVSTVASNIEAERIAQIHHSAPASLEAFDYVLRGKSLFVQFSRETHLQAQQMYEQALALDPSYVGGYVGLAWIHINGYRWGWTELPRQQALGRARDFARKALSLDPRDYAAHWVMGNVHMQAGERGQALAEYERALKLNPNAEKVLVDQAELLVYLGRANEALEQIAEAMRLNPYHPEWYYWSLGWAQYYAGAHEEGLATIRRMARMPNLARRSEAALLVRLGRVEEARAVIAALLKNDPDYTVEKARLNVAGKFSDPALMERWLDDLRAAGLPE